MRRLTNYTRPPLAPFAPVGVTLAPLHAHDDAVVHVPQETQGEGDAEFLARVFTATDRACAVMDAEKVARVQITTDLPFALSISSDWHLTSRRATAVRGLFDYAEAVRQAPGCYAVCVGDATDNAIKHKPASPKDVPDEHRLLGLLTARFGRKLLAMVGGNHDAWTEALSGVEALRSLMRQGRVHYTPDALHLIVEVVSPATGALTARYLVVLAHKYRRHSNLNYTHACWRWLEEHMATLPRDENGRIQLPDVIAIGDNHVASVETRSEPHGDVVACRMGAWQIGTGFARSLQFPRHRPTSPTVIFDPRRERQPVGYADYTEALDALRARREAAGAA